MIKRQEAIEKIANLIDNNTKVVSSLGRISRDLNHYVGQSNRSNCFFCMGSMGSTLPVALGISLSVKNKRFYAIEGDGSLIMNLGSLLTFKRYNPNNLTLLILDNKQYETTGGQKSQPEDFELYDLIQTTGLRCALVLNTIDLEHTLKRNQIEGVFDVIIITSSIDGICPRIDQSPASIANSFKNNLTNN
ncbi:thiamine pyrophosphate-dependent enzyme [Pedobacter gandavensis]|uniref:thiamine pyrophosphate-dependent enzyme n=1 Tax=Pedobacter gandavensis TaxID=2679963 RepID=UPI0024784856|nr:thiamine pyrophosphate-dependent enzyme [Pedobacter gandavensis]WGQ10943.1 thiamine pyrophosphate-dependent enzyme [Pedobacter gandavensis]